MSRTRIACIQMDCRIGAPQHNQKYITDHIKAAADNSAQLVIFPEAAITGYCFTSREEAAEFAEPVDGPSFNLIAEACRESGAYAVAGFIEKDGPALYNAVMLAGPDGLVGSYRKVHLPYLGVDRFLTPGNRPFEVFDLTFGRIGLNICYDASFPEAARALKLLGAELIVLPTNWPSGAWRTQKFIVNTRANENHLNFAAVDRTGTERGWKFIGRSKVVDYNGDTVAEAGDGEEMLIADLDLRESNHNKIVMSAGEYELDRLGDRRPEFYQIVTQMETPSPGSAPK
ncbi:MAG TPA: carbon-nitrogen hydrolase family protein [Blastocatellia bacterium]|nr:carbon-nitrogen hydrolase family protein [Blastocatellia bacterium]